MLELNNLTKVFNANGIDEKVALNHINLKVEDGDFITIIGSNGAGKSTLFNIIAGSFLSDEGSIYLNNEDITFTEEHIRSKDIGRVFQDPRLGTCANMTIEENLALCYLYAQNRHSFSILSKKDKVILKERVSLLNMGLEDRFHSQVGLLSGGQRQALTLLMATMAHPKLLLLDEHTAALDPSTADKVIELTRQMVEKDHITTLMITHNMHQALALGNRTIMMNDGKIILDIKGKEREGLMVEDLLVLFKEKAKEALDNDRILLEK